VLRAQPGEFRPNNFVLITELPIDGRVLAERLTLRGVIVRAMAGWGLSNAIRVTVGTPEHTHRFTTALQAELEALNGRHA
jgi:histidinol-phosphate/aromatic aminotransferase/cobyric acid decarboxylase-like protein